MKHGSHLFLSKQYGQEAYNLAKEFCEHHIKLATARHQLKMGHQPQM